MGLIVLILLQFVFFMISYVIFNCDFFSPAVMTIFVVLIASLMVFPSYELWKVDISEKTVITILIGELCCCISGATAKQLVKKNKYRVKSTEKSLKPIHWDFTTESIVCVSIVVLTVLYIYDALRVGRLYGGSGLNAIGYMKDAYLTGSQGPKMNVLIRQGYKIVMAISYIAAYYIANNALVLKEMIKSNWKYLVLYFCGCIITIFSGSRTEVLRLLSALILDYAVLSKANSGCCGGKKKVRLFYVAKKFAPAIVGCLIIAFASRAVVKTKGTGGSEISSIMGYVSYYVGSPIQVLNLKLSYFSNIHDLLFGTKNSIPEFVYLGNLNYGGNVASIFGSCIQYNGLIFMVVYLYLVYFIGTYAYYKIFTRQIECNKNIKKVIVFSYCYWIFTMSYYSVGTSALLESSNIIVLIFVFILYDLLREVRIKLQAH